MSRFFSSGARSFVFTLGPVHLRPGLALLGAEGTTTRNRTGRWPVSFPSSKLLSVKQSETATSSGEG